MPQAELDSTPGRLCSFQNRNVLFTLLRDACEKQPTEPTNQQIPSFTALPYRLKKIRTCGFSLRQPFPSINAKNYQ